ncbi:MAG: fumarate hydratase [Eubacteriaceae bacterium]|jgi:fumarate hydratase subunit alpha|nr:fumarate hydratase [Eubacteriaceae bacterium]
MKTLDAKIITETIKDMCIKTNCIMSENIKSTLEDALNAEISPQGCEALECILTNADIAEKGMIPLCQDTGTAVIFAAVGQDLHITGGDLTEAINEGVREGYTDGYLRKSIVDGPFSRKNTGDNTPAVIHYDIVPGSDITITVAPKGQGSENMSAVKMCKPAEGLKGVEEFIVKTVSEAGANPCPPIIVGVGVGGTMDKAAVMAKKALLREVGEHNPDPEIAAVEDELLTRINKLGIGPEGYGGTQTAMAVNMDVYPTHIAALPVAVNINCHISRHMTVTLCGKEQ